MINPDGLNVATSSKYDDQVTVYNALGKQVLDNAWEGYHCCLFAYGQTGSGKSYSMVRPPSHSYSRSVTVQTRASCPSRAMRYSTALQS